MSGPGGGGAAGVVVGADLTCATVLQDGAVRVFLKQKAGRVAASVEAVKRAAGAAIDVLTVDISETLLDAVRQSPPQLPLVAAIRIAPRPASDETLARSPARLVEKLIGRRFTVPGGHDILGHELCSLDGAAVERICAELVGCGVRQVAVVGAGSQAHPQHERAVADAIQTAVAGARVFAASDFGGHGLVAREATVVLNAALAPLVDVELASWESAVARLLPRAALRVARGDGGHCTPERVRALPIVAFAATGALEVLGAAYLADVGDCHVLLERPGGRVAGDVRNGLVVVRSAEPVGIGTELAVPTVVLSPEVDAVAAEQAELRDTPVVVPGHESAQLACVGAAVSRPTAWLDEVAFIESAAALEETRREAEQRAIAMAMANGAAPGSACVTEVSAVAVPYSPYGTVHIRVRAVGWPEQAAAGRAGHPTALSSRGAFR